MPKPPSPESLLAVSLLQRFTERLEESAPEPATLQPMLRQLEADGLLEAALRLLKQRHPRSVHEKGRGWGAVRARMELAVGQARDKRMAQWQQDPKRRLLRLRFEVRGGAAALNPNALVGALARAFLTAGLPIAMGLEKSPRPVLSLGHPLSLGTEGLGEWADATLREPLSIPLEAVASLLNHHLPEGLRVREVAEVPTLSTPVLELCEVGRWTWICPHLLLAEARKRLETFLAAERFEIEKTGKQGGLKIVKRLNVRDLVLEAAWEGATLHLATRLTGSALNTQKLLAGILGRDSAEITGLVRVAVELAADPKLADRYRYETKLSNLYEDAVLLETGGSVTVVDDEDEGTLVLGK